MNINSLSIGASAERISADILYSRKLRRSPALFPRKQRGGGFGAKKVSTDGNDHPDQTEPDKRTPQENPS
jgi:hypothetical protein